MGDSMSDSLDRFIEAQDKLDMYEKAIGELTDGTKKTHWIWFVFPQIRGMGSSRNSTYYGVEDMEEALDYLEHQILGPRYTEAVRIVHQKLLNERISLLTLMGSELDCLKFTSSLTLFSAALNKLGRNNSLTDSNLERLERYIVELEASKMIGTFPCRITENILG